MDLKKLGAQLKAARTERGLTQVELAELVGTKHSCISDYERGRRNVSVGLLHRIAVALGCKLDIYIKQGK